MLAWPDGPASVGRYPAYALTEVQERRSETGVPASNDGTLSQTRRCRPDRRYRARSFGDGARPAGAERLRHGPAAVGDDLRALGSFEAD